MVTSSYENALLMSLALVSFLNCLAVVWLSFCKKARDA